MSVIQEQAGLINSLQQFEKDGNDYICKNYDLAVKAENVLLENPDGTSISLQNSLFQFSENQNYNLVAENDNVTPKGIKWSQICNGLNNNTIEMILKPGDCLYLRPDENNEELFFPCYVIGINDHNGQDTQDLDKAHIDFMIPSMYQVIDYINQNLQDSSNNNVFDKTSDNNKINDKQVFRGLDNSDNLSDNNAMFYNSNLASLKAYHELYNYNYEQGQPDVLLGNYIKKNILKLNDDSSAFLQKKLLLLESNLDISTFYNFFSGLNMEHNLIVLREVYEWIEEYNRQQEANDNIGQIIDLSKSALKEADIERITDNTNSDFNGLRTILNGFISLSSYALKILRYTTGFSSEFLNNNVFCFLDNENSPLSTIIKASLALKIQGNSIMANSYPTSSIYNFILASAHYFYKFNNGLLVSDEKIKNFSYKVKEFFWGLTEYEVFGDTILGNKPYSQGQCFQYPAFQKFIFKDKIIQKTDQTSLPKSYHDFATITLCTNNDTPFPAWVGYNKEMPYPFCPTEISAKGTYDAPFCFRLQATSSI